LTILKRKKKKNLEYFLIITGKNQVSGFFQHDRALLISKRVSCVNIVQKFIENIKQRNHLNSFINVFENDALKRAELIDKKINNGNAGPLAGMILAIKDNIAVKDKPMTCGSEILRDFNSPYNATVVQRLEQADAVVIGKTNMDEFGMGSSGENSAFGATLNPADVKRTPGGSSSGSATAVAAELVHAALGTDTGGSVRQPAAFTGVVGFRPTYGRISRFGLTAFASSFDQIGVFAHNVEDCALILNIISGFDPKDATSADIMPINTIGRTNTDFKGVKIGVVREYLDFLIAPEIKNCIEKVVEFLKNEGAEIIPVSLSLSEYEVSVYYFIANAEASSNLSRYDGVRYGYRFEENGVKLRGMYKKTRSLGLGREVKTRILMGTNVLSSKNYESLYKRAVGIREEIKKEYDSVLNTVDFLLSPVSPTLPFLLGEKKNDSLRMYLSDLFTVSAPLCGLPAISLPVCRRMKLPVGVQFTAARFRDDELLNFSNKLLKIFNWGDTNGA